MSSIIEEDSQLRQSVYTALESKGVLNSVRAKLRSEVFQAIQEADGKVISPFGEYGGGQTDTQPDKQLTTYP